nr:phosphotyrosine protein phosphatase [Ahniella affigens]
MDTAANDPGPKRNGDTLNVLFVCSRNQWRSPTGEALFRKHPGLNVRSAGTSAQARRRVAANDLIWADLILVMETKHRERLRAEFPRAMVGKTISVLDIPDDYRYMDPELCDLLERAVTQVLSQVMQRA